MGKKTTRAAPKKKDTVKRIKKLLETSPVLGLINMSGLPASQFQRIRADLGDRLTIVMARKTLMERAMKAVKDKIPGVDKLLERLKGMPALLFTKENPFTLYATIRKTKSKAPIKPGQEAPYDLDIPEGPTPFPPGPIISELAGLRIKAAVEGGKVVVKSDTVVAKEGEPVSSGVSSLLLRLGIQPMEIGLTVDYFLEKGIIYGEEALSITQESVLSDMGTAYAQSTGLAMDLGWFTAEIMEPLLTKAGQEARGLALEANILTAETIPYVLGKAEAQAKAIKEMVPEAPAPAEEKKEEKKEETKKEEGKKEEAKKEEPKKEEAKA